MRLIDFIKERGLAIKLSIKCDPERWVEKLFKRKKEKKNEKINDDFNIHGGAV